MEAGDELNEPSGVGEDHDTLMKLEILPGIPLDILFVKWLLEALNAGF